MAPVTQEDLPDSSVATISATSSGLPMMSRKSSPRYCPANPPGSRAPFGMSMEGLWRGAINTSRNARRSVNFMVFEPKNNAIRLANKIARLFALRITILTFISILMTPSAMLADCQLGFESTSHLDAGFQSLYDLNFEAAKAQFSDWKARYPDDPLGPAAAASSYLFREFDRLGVLQSELFRDDQTFHQRKKLTSDPRLKALFDSEITLSETLAAKQLAKDPASVNALLAMTMVNGLRADYAALIERKDSASLSYTKKGRKLAEKLLMIDSRCYDAHLALGVENYLLGTKPAPVRWLLRAGGANTNRGEGLRELQLTAERGHFLKPFAKLLLAVAALRRHDDQNAKLILSELHREFPHNLLYERELARLQTERGD